MGGIVDASIPGAAEVVFRPTDVAALRGMLGDRTGPPPAVRVALVRPYARTALDGRQ